MIRILQKFCRDTSGAVTVDWVILTASVVALATVAYVGIDSESGALSQQIASTINAEIGK